MADARLNSVPSNRSARNALSWTKESRSFEEAYDTLCAWCRIRDYAGHDPFDGLNSRIFQLTPLKHSRFARLAWIQAFKRSPVSMRRIALVPAAHNAKGVALFALASLSRFRATGRSEHADEARKLIERLIDMRSPQTPFSAWGYDFDWQNRAFLAAKGTPTIVPTAFAARALIEASALFNERRYLEIASSSCDFILKGLNVTHDSTDEICWSYSPLDQTRVFNASLLAAETLAGVGAAINNPKLIGQALLSAQYVIRRQNSSGSWSYGVEGFQSWADNFHTAFVLTSLNRIALDCGGIPEMEEAIRKGYRFWIENFFEEDGWPKYYPDRLYPADVHSAGAALVAFAELERLDVDAGAKAARVAGWAIRNLRDAAGYFYYQKRRFYTVRTPYIRWSQAWMLYGLARTLEMSKSSRL
jgi:hypothetical protein